MEPILLILLLVVFVALPLFSMRKQSKRLKEIKSFQEQLQPGMVVKMTCGLQGRISHVGEHTVDIEVSAGVVTTWDKAAVLERVDSVDTGSQQEQQLTRDSRDDAPEASEQGIHSEGDDLNERPNGDR